MTRPIASHLSIHTRDAQLLLRPSAQLNALLGGIFAYLQAKERIKIYAICVLANHMHLVYKKPSRAQYSFQQSLLDLITKRVNSLLSRRGGLWESRFDEQAIFDHLDLLESIIHVNTNPVHHALVPEPHLWPGLKSLDCMDKSSPATFLFTDHEAEYKSSRTGSPRRKDEFQSKHELRIAKMPILSQLSHEQYYQVISRLSEQRAIEIASRHTTAKRRFLGLKQILEQSPFNYPKNYRPRIQGVTMEQLQELLPQQLSQVVPTRGVA
jgi:REP element-mobilizing transposase RayT